MATFEKHVALLDLTVLPKISLAQGTNLSQVYDLSTLEWPRNLLQTVMKLYKVKFIQYVKVNKLDLKFCTVRDSKMTTTAVLIGTMSMGFLIWRPDLLSGVLTISHVATTRLLNTLSSISKLRVRQANYLSVMVYITTLSCC